MGTATLPIEEKAVQTGKKRQVFTVCVGLVIVLTIGAFHFCTIRDGHDWGDDFAMYILQARNLITGGPLPPTEYVYDRTASAVGPPFYPPGFPVLLAPVIATFGLNVYAMKAEQVIFLTAALLFIFALAFMRLGAATACAVVAILGASPLLWEVKDTVTSDIPFLLLSSAALVLITYAESREWRDEWVGLVAAIAVYAAIATRTVGWALIPAMASFAITHRALPPVLKRSLLLVAGLVAIQYAAIHSKGSYFDQLTQSPLRIFAYNAKEYAFHFGRSILRLRMSALELPFTVTVLLLGVVGFWRACRREIRALEVFTAAYLLLILFWPGDASPRLLLPVLAPIALLFWEGMNSLPVRFRQGCVAMMLAITAFGYVHFYTRMPRGPIQGGITDQDFSAVCAHISNAVPSETVILFKKPRLAGLMTGRRFVAQESGTNQDSIRKFLRQYNISYVLELDNEPQDSAYFDAVKSAATLVPSYEAGPYHLYRVVL
jgi:hypothetical protein